MRWYRCLCVLLIAFAASACGTSTQEAGVTLGAVTVSQVWMRTPIPGVDTDAIYMVISNTGDQDDALISVRSDVSAHVEIHATTDTNGVMAMRPVDSIALPAHSSVSLQAGVYHVMLVGRTRTVQRGEQVAVQLQFQHAGSITVQAEVRDSAPEAD
jgi:periplasmic copper chaperone A